MQSPVPIPCLRRLCVISALVACLAVAGCQRFHHTDTQPLFQSGMWSDTIKQLGDLNVSESEVNELIKLHEAGLSDDGCVQLMRLARSRKEMFTSGDAVANMLHSGMAESTVLELAKLDQIGTWTGEAESIRLAGFSDQVVLAVAHRRANHQPTVSGTSLVELKNTGVDEQQALTLIARGLTDEQAGQMIGAHQQGELPRGFTRGTTRRHR